MKLWKKMLVGFWMLVMGLCMSALPVGAAQITYAKPYELINVKKAEKLPGKWVKKENGGYRYRLESGGAAKNVWLKVNGKIYYLNKSGYRTSGWIEYRGKLYFAKKNGALAFGWLKRGKKVYYLRNNGSAAMGKLTIDGVVYHFDKKTGVRSAGWANLGRKRCYFDEKTGQMKRSCWIKTGDKYYYVGSDGVMLKSCWLVLKNKRYYLGSDGARLTGSQYLDGKGYYFKENGVYDPSVKVEPQIDPSKKMVALTFDDGPGAYTGRLLDCLERNHAKATFFMVGTNVANYKSTVKRMANLGCELGNHSYNHSSFTSLSYDSMRWQVTTTNNLIYSAAGAYPTLFRLPYGNGYNSSTVLSALQLPSIYWSIDPRDWANTGDPQHTVNAVLDSVQSGDIVLMHDIYYSTVRAAETIIPSLISRGYQLVTVSELAKYKGNTNLSAGRTYFHFR